MKLKKWEIALMALVLTAALTGGIADREQRELAGKLVRLHVVANSDSEADQAAKLLVRDAVLHELRPLLEGVSDAETAGEIIEGALPAIEQIAAQTANESVTAHIGTETFPTVEYDTFSLPAGEYTALRVVIGEGRGHNWWCVVFPPVCDAGTLDVSAAAELGLTEDELSLITEDSPRYVIRFRVIEWLDRLRQIFGHNTFS